MEGVKLEPSYNVLRDMYICTHLGEDFERSERQETGINNTDKNNKLQGIKQRQTYVRTTTDQFQYTCETNRLTSKQMKYCLPKLST